MVNYLGACPICHGNRAASDLELFTREQLIAAVAAEREACAKLVETCPLESYASESHTRQARANRESIAAAIRARKD